MDDSPYRRVTLLLIVFVSSLLFGGYGYYLGFLQVTANSGSRVEPFIIIVTASPTLAP